MPSKLADCSVCGKQRRIEMSRDKCYGCRKMEIDVRKGRIRTPDYPNANVRKYKEPMEPVDGGYGYYGAITETDDGEHIQCHICGYFFANLSTHVAKHDLKIKEYKLKFGLRIVDGLISPKERIKRQTAYNEHIRSKQDRAFFKEMARKAQQTIKERGIKTGGNNWSMQTRNEKGMCKEQTAAKIRAVADLMGGVPTQVEFMRLYGSGQREVVDHWFGSWRDALRELGLTHYTTYRIATKLRRQQQAINRIRAFYESEGRTPQWSDFNSVDYLPSGKRVSYLFGTLNLAREAAGVPILMRRGRGRWIERQPKEEV